jgi:hypothetical protein
VPLVYVGWGDDGEEGEADGSDAAVAVGVVEENGEAGAIVLFWTLLKVGDMAGDDGASSQGAGRIVPIESCFSKNGGSASEFARIEGSQEFGLEWRLRIDAAFLVGRSTLSVDRRAEEKEGRG